jgi:7-cyano-7-deazaguanine synthase
MGRMISPDGALVLFSGGQDSTVCLAWALARFARVETVGFDYGQRHAVELAARDRVRACMAAEFPGWAGRLGPDHVLEMRGFGALADSALTADRAIEMTEKGLPSTFVPGRNLAFLVYAAALADRRGLRALVGGMCETDYSGYPDCRRETLEAQLAALNLGMAQDFVLETPLMWLTKAETWALAKGLGGEPLVALTIEESHTCYLGVRGVAHPWGHGCGECPACILRANGFEEWVSSGRPSFAEASEGKTARAPVLRSPARGEGG